MQPDVPTHAWKMMIAAVVVWLASSLGFAVPVRAQGTCFPGCDPNQPTSAACCPPCLQAACVDYDSCRDFSDQFDACVERARANRLGGHCALTRDLLNECRQRRAARERTCRGPLRKSVRAGCSSVLGVSCSLSKRAARKACQRCESVFATTTTTIVGGPTPRQRGDGEVDCQARCIRRIVGDCYSDCFEGCGPDRTAREICQEGCRDSVCRYLRLACTDNEKDASKPYRTCCERQDDCEDDVECETTTTVTTTTRTTTTSTTSTTQGFSVTTTSTTTTLP